jgi:hypothetical protein
MSSQIKREKQGKTTKGNFTFVLKQEPKSNYMQKRYTHLKTIYKSKNKF